MTAGSDLPTAGDTLVIATHNAGKLREISEILKATKLTAISGERITEEPEETGTTFEANALIKAENGATYYPGQWVLADDSGLEVDILDGAPGIYSARWAGTNKDFGMAMQRIHDEITAKGYSPNGQSARFVCVLALAQSDETSITFRGTVEGTLSFPPRGDQGFGYDPIFVPKQAPEYTFAEMEPEAKHRISHRANAFQQLLHALAQTTKQEIVSCES